MRYRQLGNTGLQVSELSFGSMTFGGGRTIGGLDQAQANDLVAIALEAGVNLFDTADTYSRGESERMLGKALGSRRSEVLLASKVRLRTGPGVNDIGLSRAHIHEAIDASLERLGTDYLDLYQVHVPDSYTPLEETMKALDDLVRWGKVRYLGCCNYPAWELMKAQGLAERHGWSRFVSLQAHYTLATRDAERELVPLVQDQHLSLLVWSPLAGGALSGKTGRDGTAPRGTRRSSFHFPPVDDERVRRVVEQMDAIAARSGSPTAAVALSWLLSRPFVTSVILGARRPEQLRENLLASELELLPDELQRLDEASELPQEYPGWMLAHPWDERMPQAIGRPPLAATAAQTPTAAQKPTAAQGPATAKTPTAAQTTTTAQESQTTDTTQEAPRPTPGDKEFTQ